MFALLFDDYLFHSVKKQNGLLWAEVAYRAVPNLFGTRDPFLGSLFFQDGSFKCLTFIMYIFFLLLHHLHFISLSIRSQSLEPLARALS